MVDGVMLGFISSGKGGSCRCCYEVGSGERACMQGGGARQTAGWVQGEVKVSPRASMTWAKRVRAHLNCLGFYQHQDAG